ncbi:MAG: CPBP family intramembrane glutamic endopeptidase [Candidatus Thorarchaeota archaeon]
MKDQADIIEEKPRHSIITNGFLFILFIGSSFLVFNVGGYNNFIPSDLILITRITVVGMMFLTTFILHRSERLNKYWKTSFSLLIVSIGLLLAWIFGRWYALIPGLSTNTVEGAAVAKFAEVLPIVVAIIVGVWLLERNFTPIFLQGGNIRKGLKMGFLASPAALFPFIALGGLGFSASLGEVISWMPWICLFSFSNACMEELMIRGLFLREYNSLIGKRQSLILTSIIFALFHQAIIGFPDILTILVYFSIPLTLGLLWGYVIQESDNIWGAVLAHMIADIFFVLAMFGV